MADLTPDLVPPEVEAKARELCIADGKDPDRDWRVGESATMSYADPHPENWRRYIKAARAALEG